MPPLPKTYSRVIHKMSGKVQGKNGTDIDFNVYLLGGPSAAHVQASGAATRNLCRRTFEHMPE